VAGNETIARVRGLRVLGHTGHAARPLVDDVNFDLRRGERLGVAGGAASGTSALGRAISGRPALGETVVGGSVEVGGAVRRLANSDGDGGGDGDGPRVRLVAVTQAANRTDAVRREREAIRRALDEGAEVVVVDQTSDFPREFAEEPNAVFLARVFAAHEAAVVLVTEDLGVLRQTCDTVQVLLAGRIVERGPAGAILSYPRHRYAQTLVIEDARRGRLDPGDRRSEARWAPTARQPLDGCAFEPGCPVGRGRHDCATTFPQSRSFPSPFGSVTAKCHQPADGGRNDQEETR
jgi:ABC-type dipeptide/oligopeptide/nickel transport system ATPase component